MFPLEVPKRTDFIHLHTYTSAIKYVQHEKNSCVLISFPSDLFDSIEYVADQSITS